jgi:hypothetical protein
MNIRGLDRVVTSRRVRVGEHEPYSLIICAARFDQRMNNGGVASSHHTA